LRVDFGTLLIEAAWHGRCIGRVRIIGAHKESSMAKKVIFGLLAVVAIVIVAAIVFTRTQLDGIVASAVESYGSTATGTDVNVGSVDISVREGHGTIGKLVIDNPKGYSSDYALSIENIDVSLDLASLARAVPVVKEVVLMNAHLNAEQRGGATNITDIQRHLGEVDTDTADTETEGKIIIDRFLLKNGRVTLVSDALNEPEELELADVVIDGIGRTSGGVTYGQATEAVLNPILAATRNAIENRLKSAAANAAQEEVKKKANERLKELLDKE
jgi:hypothetical protein